MSALWMKISKDEPELPEAVAYSARELSHMTGYTVNNIRGKASKRKNKGEKTDVVRVEIDEEEVN
ncbi:MAG: hypothetical protein MJ097_00520 [Dorea sp.]|nr:hypothetical protein [Dorea sp.]